MTTTLPATTDLQFLANYLINTRVYGVVVPPDQIGNEFFATFEVQGDQGTLTMAAIIGPRGPAGQDAFLLYLQNDAIDDPANLPETLQNTVADVGKTWLFDDVDGEGNIIGASAWIWYGTAFRRMMLGSPGPPGAIPIITPSVELIPSNQASDVAVDYTNPKFPAWLLKLAVPPGPAGPAPAFGLCPDVDENTNPPVGTSLLGWTGRYTTGYLEPPKGLQAIADTGGTFTPGTVYYAVTVTNAAGETVAARTSIALANPYNAAQLSWQEISQVSGATGISIYRGTAPGAENTRVTHITDITTVSYVDTNAAGTAASPPTVSTASRQYPLWVPVSVAQLMPGPFSMPESAFTSFSGLSQRAAIGSFQIPPQPFDWTPICWGHIGAFGLELSANPLMIGGEIRLGDPTAGQLVSRGFGNTLGEVNFMPHYSDPNNPGTAITPSNGTAVVPAHHTNPAQGTLYTNLYNDGTIGTYQFSPTDAQVFVLVMPVA